MRTGFSWAEERKFLAQEHELRVPSGACDGLSAPNSRELGSETSPQLPRQVPTRWKWLVSFRLSIPPKGGHRVGSNQEPSPAGTAVASVSDLTSEYSSELGGFVREDSSRLVSSS